MDGLGTILQAPNMHRIAKAQYEQRRDEQKANNKLRKAQGDLATWSRSLNNRRRVKGAEEQYNRGMEILSHETRQIGKQITNASLSLSEQQGNLRALAALSGVGGASVEAMENLVSLQDATTTEEMQQALDKMGYSGHIDAASLMENAYEGQDFSQTVVDFDNAVHIAPKAMKRRLGKLIGVGVASFFLGPEGGKAVADFAVGEWEATNANYGDAMKNFGSAIQSGVSAMKQYSERDGTPWGEDVMRGMRKSSNVTNATTTKTTKKAGSDSKGKSWFK